MDCGRFLTDPSLFTTRIFPPGSLFRDGLSIGAYGGEEICIQSFGGETWGKETTGETQA